MNKKINLKWIFITLFIIGVMYRFGSNFAPGSYPYAEKYELNYSEAEVMYAINKFKQENPEQKVPNVTINNKTVSNLIDGRDSQNGYWCFFYFFYKKENKIILTWTRSYGDNKTIFAFISINDGLNLGNWKKINKDFGFFENRAEKKKFEERILNPVKTILQK